MDTIETLSAALAALTARVEALETAKGNKKATAAKPAKPAASALPRVTDWSITLPATISFGGVYGRVSTALAEKHGAGATVTRAQVMELAATMDLGKSKTPSILAGDLRLFISRLPAPVTAPVAAPVDAPKAEEPKAPVLDINTGAEVTEAPKADEPAAAAEPKTKRTRKAQAGK